MSPAGASHKKLAISGPSSEPVADESDCVGELEGYRLVNFQEFKATLEASGTHQSLSTHLVREFGPEDCMKVVTMPSLLSDSYAKSTKCLNARSILAMWSIDCGQSSTSTFCGIVDMLPPL